MKKMSRFLAIFLILALMISCFSITAFATEKDESLAHYNNGTGYVAFGDSVTRGWGAPGFTAENIEYDSGSRNVAGSYTKIIADTLGCTAPDDMAEKNATYWPIAQNAMTTAMVVDLLGIEDNYRDDEFLYGYRFMKERYTTNLSYFGDEESFAADGVNRYGQIGKVRSVRDLVENASLITLALGMGDILNRGRQLASDVFFAEGGDLLDLSASGQIVKDFIARMYEGYKTWQKDFPLILDYLKNNAQNATVVIVGAFNPIFAMTLTEDIPVQIGTAMSAISNLMNQNYKRWAKEYGYIYVDVSNVETGAALEEMSIIEFLNADFITESAATHPTKEGYEQMARMILNALRENDAVRKTKKSTIKVDLGAIGNQNITSVTVNGIKLPKCAYSVDDCVLTIPNNIILGRRLTVSAVSADGRQYISTYDLDFNLCGGYVATRVYASTDFAAVCKKVLMLPFLPFKK